jgi:hypothetical protein
MSRKQTLYVFESLILFAEVPKKKKKKKNVSETKIFDTKKKKSLRDYIQISNNLSLKDNP